MNVIHSDAHSWKDNWDSIRELPSGGQASSKVAKRRDGTIERAFLKILNKQKDSERRARLYREVASLETLSVAGVPRLLETNARHYEDYTYLLYFVTEYIDGNNLREFDGDYTHLQAIEWTIQLCAILGACRDAGVNHRDIKPENCIITPDQKLYLVDFGLSFHANMDIEFNTQIGQEIGNRFLRLPELHADSPNKNDPRTDLTSCVGILFYLLTKTDPRVLVDAYNKYPHQRDAVVGILRHSDIPRVDRLLSLFDQGFQTALDMRFQSVESLRDALTACLSGRNGTAENVEMKIARIRERTNSPAYAGARSAMDALKAITSQIYNLTVEICGSLGNVFTLVSSSDEISVQNLTYLYRMGFLYSLDNKIMLVPDYVLRHVGTEIILSVRIGGKDECIVRMPSNPGQLDLASTDKIRSVLIERLENIVMP
jgi:serine/threonine protein kinase